MVPWKPLLVRIKPHYPKAGRGCGPYLLIWMARIQMMQNWSGLSDPGMEDALYENVSMRQCAQLPLTGARPGRGRDADLRFLLETHQLALKLLEVMNVHLAESGVPRRRMLRT